ncbi:TY-Chap domain-containing protein [Actinoplanes regularis]|uniref:TY-Chap N-terminal domain-containing protein n=1 Tax=Actinoplanes regularis TaxID=52697 RepID=A0A239BGI3_9ACTN|nr:hypothetical protein Are01nite_44600 [Actinoplanes regularis]SNS06742.1 hypothetical protein SAMN06264365_109184 [Actinoplanes regularis]
MEIASRSPSWETFRRGLAAGIGRGCIDDAVILAWDELGFVQFIQGDDTIDIQVSDNKALPLDARQRAALVAAGWDPPGGGFGPLWSREVRWRPDHQMFDEVAQLITATLQEAIGLRSPADLDIKAFSTYSGDDFELPVTPGEYERAASDVELRLADVRLHDATAAFLIDKEGLSARTVAVPARAADRRPTHADAGEYFLDRVLYVDGDDPHILVLSHVGPSGLTGSRLVPPRPGVDGPFIRAEQGSAPYLRYLLQRNVTVAAALAADPELCERMSALLRTGRADVIRARRVAVDSSGSVTVTTMRLAPQDVDVPTLRLPVSSVPS